MAFSNPSPSHDDIANLACQACGVFDASLRASSHPVVVSTLVAASETRRLGIWCARCRGIEAAKAAATSLLAGWWSLRGPAKTIAALRANLAGGEQNASANAQMLRAIARRQYDLGNPEFAALFAAAAHAVQPQRDNSRLLDDLRRAGHRPVLPQSPWRFAAWVPVALFAVVLGGLGLRLVAGGEDEASASAAAPVQASVAAVVPPSKSEGIPSWKLASASAADLEKQLGPDADPKVARAYFRARMGELRSGIRSRIERGEPLITLRTDLSAIAGKPGVSRVLEEPSIRAAWDKLHASMDLASRCYNGGAPVDAIARTANESFQVTVDVAIEAIGAEMIGHSDRSSAGAAEVDARVAGIEEARMELRIRGAVIGTLSRAMDACVDAVR